MTRVLFGLLILLKIILYSKYESRHTRRHEGSTLALLEQLILSQKARVQGSLSGHIGRLAIAKPIHRRSQHAH